MKRMKAVKEDINKGKLTPLERSARNSIIWHLSEAGFTVSSIARVLRINQSVASRIVDKKPERTKIIDTILWGNDFGQLRD